MTSCVVNRIQTDENLHTAVTQRLIKQLKQDDEFWVEMFEECKNEIEQMYIDTVEQEVQWADYLFSKGSMMGLNKEVLVEYIKFIAGKRMKAVGLKNIFGVTKNPLNWMDKWTGSNNVQVAPQETEVTSYIQGAVESDLNKKDNKLAGFEL